MYRAIEQELLVWKDHPGRMPLLLRGARQVGKTYLVECFGQRNFQNTVTINFDLYPELKACFSELDPQKIINKIKLTSGKPINPGKTLLFFDEVQECPQALKALRYFKEHFPEQHVIAAGSLLEFTLNDQNFSMPVGRIQSLFLKPLSFKEFLLALGESQLNDYLNDITLNETIATPVHSKLINLLRDYLIIGGMPAVVQYFVTHRDYSFCQRIQADILTTYRNDFGKYARKAQHKYLQQVFSKLPGLVAKHFKYVDIDPDSQSRDLKVAIQTLTDAGLIYPIYMSQASGLPLSTTASFKRFKLIFLDTGLVNYSTHLQADLLLDNSLNFLHKGTLTEQFVGQELLTLYPPYETGELFYWQRDRRNSKAEVDYLTNVESIIVPIEVKAGGSKRVRSLKILMEEKKLKKGIILNTESLSLHDGILNLPLYMIAELPRLVKTI